ncbi:hypothetical protein ACV772_002498 [Proteus mirabilis]|uniref:hypothetical protein n=1 Tax=Proteus TaxID=583 RepID=UPI000A5012DB|nr:MULTISPECIES: hypothetical protein [Proteus]EIM6939591.1 hypothetical protein [Proteus mirabilis]EKT8250544.1 hypothetical protein [Proteus mirabilis]EKW2646183.1 hypothetical protein [Proteus mirabilis]EKX6256794.1 hypothetical protein [Proteus mirabilis]EKX8357887.1 hypothetical protein [Proteus mirabilis]
MPFFIGLSVGIKLRSTILYSLFSILYSLFSILYSLFSILYILYHFSIFSLLAIVVRHWAYLT